jgi:hypothetical protein
VESNKIREERGEAGEERYSASLVKVWNFVANKLENHPLVWNFNVQGGYSCMIKRERERKITWRVNSSNVLFVRLQEVYP